ncbi:MAG: hypothetical protein RLZZ58_1246, partial [Pseudomonadota bacterium]
DYAYITAAAGLVVVRLSDPVPADAGADYDYAKLNPVVTAVLPLTDARASAVQFRYLWVTDADGVKLFDVSNMAVPVPVPSGTVPLANAQRIYLARTYMYVAAKQDGLVIVNVTRPASPAIYQRVTLTPDTPGGMMDDAEDVIVASTNASLFAYVADGRNGMKILQLTSPDSQPNFYGFSPKPMPALIAWARTPSPARALSKGLDRDRAVDESGGQVAVFGRLGSRPFTRSEMEALFLNKSGLLYKVSDTPDMDAWR